MQAQGNAAMSRSFLCILLCLSFMFTYTSAEVVHYYDFLIQETPVKRLCKDHNILTVNGQYPGPTLVVRNGDSLVVKVVNQGKYNITIHWHGVRQLRNGWADGPAYVTQCPIMPGGTYTYRFTIVNQEGTLWWHAHASWLRTTVHGALVILPKEGSSYPFPKPDREIPIILAEWWNRNPQSVLRQALITGAAPNVSDAFFINGQPGDLFPCDTEDTTVIPVIHGQTNLLRFVGATLNSEMFVSIGGHKMTVVAVDASYTKPFTTSVLQISPGQTVDVLLTTDLAAGRYYMAARVFASATPTVPFDNTTATAILEYADCPIQARRATPVFPILPAFNDSAAAAAFAAGLRSPGPVKVPAPVDDNLYVTVGLGLFNCPPGRMCGGPNNTRFGASMNNVSFTLPRQLSILQAYFQGVNGVFTQDFPPVPPVIFNFASTNVPRALQQPVRGTKAYPVKFGSVVQLVYQDTGIVATEQHPMHIHGYEFYIIGTGTGNFNPAADPARFNLVDPPRRNTVGVPAGGWAAIRFVADNPGIWFVHCHIDSHLVWGLAMVFQVENGEGELESVIPPPPDLPKC